MSWTRENVNDKTLKNIDKTWENIIDNIQDNSTDKSKDSTMALSPHS